MMRWTRLVVFPWGGDADSCITVDFQASSQALEAELAADGHAILECVHNCGHGVPPFENGDGLLSAAPLWEYLREPRVVYAIG